MGQGNLPAGGKELVLLLLAAALPAQGPLYRENWGYLHLSRLRATVRHELQGRDLAMRERIAATLAADDQGIPFRGPAKALALLRDTSCDDAFVFRCMVSAYVLPEVVDPDADNVNCRELNVSVFLPFLTKAPDTPHFEVDVTQGSTRVFHAEITEDTAPEDLRMARARTKVPCSELADGRYELSIRTFFGDDGPRPHDYVLRHSFAVLRGYQKRAEAAMTRARLAVEHASELDAALLQGLAAEVVRAYTGEAFAVESTAVADLEHLEAALQNVAADKPPLAGMTGRITASLPAGTQRTLGLTFDLPAEPTPKPLLLIAPAAPAYDVHVRRPGAPTTTSPRLLAEACAHFDPQHRFHIVYLESPGGGIDYAAAVQRALEQLPQLLPIKPGKVAIVAEREAAVALGYAVPQLRDQVQGLALVAGGGLSPQALQQLHGMHLLVCPAQDDPISDGLLRARDLVAGKYRKLEVDGEFSFDPAPGRAWTFGVPQSWDAIAAMCARAFAER